MTTAENICIAPYTSMKVGGRVRKLYTVEMEDELCTLLCRLHSEGTPFFVIGNASNLLFPDEGFDGAVVSTVGMKEISLCDGKIVASAGVTLSTLARFACEHSLSGLAFAYGIPGTVGGGVYMNAGAYGGEMADVLEEVLCVTPSGEKVRFSKEELHLSYRLSRLQEEELYLLHAVFACPRGEREEIKAEMEKNMNARRSKQPLEYPSCGSAFKRPQGHFAGALIEQAGLKGYSVGGAQVSEKHAGFIINTGNATANDVKALIAHVQTEVQARFGVLLEPEIRII